MLSRMADSLFWLSRYIERAENQARILDVAQRLAGLPLAYAGGTNEWESAIATAGCGAGFAASHGQPTRENVVAYLVAGDANPSSIRRCIETARTNARAVRTAITSEMWEIVNGIWHETQHADKALASSNGLAEFLNLVKQASLRFDGAAYRTMLRSDHYWFQRLGTMLERADNTARLLDVKYHLLLPEREQVGGGLDYFQWTAILRSVNALTSYHWVYRDNVQPWLVAEFLILRPEQPRSLRSCYADINGNLDQIAEAYGRQGKAQRIARTMVARLENTDIDALFQSGLHEFLTAFIEESNRLGTAITEQYLS
jgi:uncharacterized alpha-E superfamily protein